MQTLPCSCRFSPDYKKLLQSMLLIPVFIITAQGLAGAPPNTNNGVPVIYQGGNFANGYKSAGMQNNATLTGLNYRFYQGNWNTLPDFSTISPIMSGSSANVDISARPSGINDHFAFIWEGFINITIPGMYTFETVSDDGSQLFFNTLYSSAGEPLINNDGIHHAISSSGSINITTPGLYPIAITYFEKDGGEQMQLYWTVPGSERQVVPDAAFFPVSVDNVAPATPVNPHVVYKGRTFARLDWEDASDNAGVAAYEVFINGAIRYTTTESFINADALSPNTTYTFNVNAVDAAGNKSAYSSPVTFTTVHAGLTYKIYANVSNGQQSLETLPFYSGGISNNVDISKTPTALTVQYAYLWRGYINIPTPGIYTFETISDDGSRVYFNAPYADDAIPLLDNWENNGEHGPVSVSKTINIPSAGLYPIVIRYHQYGGGTMMQLHWQGPGFSRQAVPDAAFTDDSMPGFLVNGLNYKYYEGNWENLPDFNALTPVKTGQSANVDLGLRTPGHNDHFGFVWEGFITVQDPGDYTFETISDDGSKFYFNSKYIPTAIATVDNDGLHPETSAKATVHIAVAGTYPIAITFFENTGDEKLQVYWSGPKIARQLLPSEVLSPNPGTQMERLAFKFYVMSVTELPDFTIPSPLRTGTSHNADISARLPQWNDIFAFIWQGYINIPSPGMYTFETVSSDGSKLYFNKNYSFSGIATVDNDGVHEMQSATGTVYVEKAGIYPISITYFEQYLTQALELYWAGPGMLRQRIPDEAFTLLHPDDLRRSRTLNDAVASTPASLTSDVTGKEFNNIKSIFPNPFNESLTVEIHSLHSTDEISFGLYDLTGREVFRKRTGRLPVGNNTIKINLASLNIKDGVYILQVQKNGLVWKTEQVTKLKR